MESLLYKELTDNEISSIVSASLGSKLVSSKLLTGGLFNTSYLIRTDGGDKYVLRAGPVNRHLLLPYEHHLMEAEKEVCRLFSLSGVPGSEVVACDVSRGVIDRDLMIVKYINGRSLSEENVSPELMNDISVKVGTVCRRIHGITSNKFGRVYDVMNGGGFDTWAQALTKEAEDTFMMCGYRDIFTSSELSSFMHLFERSGELLKDIDVPSLVHCDIWEGNILVGGDPPGFMAVIDGDRAL